MSLPAWPDIAYKPDPSAYNRVSYLPPIATDMDGGNTRLRKKPGSNVATVTQTIEFRQADYDLFVAFILEYGAARFTMPVWWGNAYVTKTVQIMEPPQEVYLPDGARVSMKLRVYP
jgi:hypothetical protein